MLAIKPRNRRFRLSLLAAVLLAGASTAPAPLLAQPVTTAPDSGNGSTGDVDLKIPEAPNSRPSEGPGPGISLQQQLQLPDWLDFSVGLQAEPLANTGGLDRSRAWSQQLTLGAAFTSGLGKEETHWRESDHWALNTQLMLFSGRQNYGSGIGAAFPLQSTDHPSGLWLTEASLERRRGLGPLTIKGGLLSLNPDFIDMPVFDLYVHSALDNTLNITVFGPPINPLIAPGGVATLDLGQAGTLRIGAYWLSAETPLAELFGANPQQPTINGTAQLLQWNFRNLPGTRRVGDPIVLGERRIGRQLPPPLLQLGALHSSTDLQGTNRVVFGAVNLPLQLPFGLDHRLWAGMNVGLDPANNAAPLFLSGGWAVQGLLRSRPHDVLALGLGRTSFCPQNGLGPSYEGVIELNYNAALSTSLSLGPVLQLILNPGGADAVPSIVAAGLQFQLSL